MRMSRKTGVLLPSVPSFGKYENKKTSSLSLGSSTRICGGGFTYSNGIFTLTNTTVLSSFNKPPSTYLVFGSTGSENNTLTSNDRIIYAVRDTASNSYSLYWLYADSLDECFVKKVRGEADGNCFCDGFWYIDSRQI
ncbi:MAG: hypothetical protein PUE85_01330 [Firmicutes bacterium]|nr:hypothetical protein [Bacillota bacterium]